MKKVATLIIAFIMMLSTSLSTTYAASYFSNNKALDDLFKKLEKEFLKYEKDEVIPLRSMGAIITDKNQERIKRTSRKMSDKQVKEAAQKKLNEIRVVIELKEEELGGLSKQEYKIISDHLTGYLQLAKGSSYTWDFEGKNVSLYLDVYEDSFYNFKGLVGNFARMGKEKDQVNVADLRVKGKITRYLNQSIQKGNKIGKEILNKLPGEVEKLFIESSLSRIEASRVLYRIHDQIYNPDINNYFADQYDGSTSIDKLLEGYEIEIEWARNDREAEKRFDYFEYSKDIPSSKAKDSITKQIINEELPQTFTYGFNKPVTLEELARLYFESTELNDKIEIEGNVIDKDSPDYVKQAFIYGMIDGDNNLKQPLTRLEAARYLVNGAIYRGRGFNNILRITDCAKIPIADQVIVSTCITGGMLLKIDKFEPQASYIKEDAILDREMFKFNNLRGYKIPFSLKEPEKIILGKNTIHLIFENKDEILDYMDDYFDDTVLGKLMLKNTYTKIDTGCALIEVLTPENGIKFTIKKGSTYIDFEEGVYGPGLAYDIEPKVLKKSDKVDMNMQVDAIHKKLFKKLDEILAKIIKPGMTEEQKVKAIHDFVVKHITYDSKLQDEHTIQSIIYTIDNGRGVCGDYALLFMHLCRRASIPCTFEAGDPFTFNHAWNAVFVNGKWLFVDTTWDDGPNGKVLYTYFLKDRFTFMNTHTPYMGVPEYRVYTDIDSMKIKNQDELRGYLLNNFYWIDGFKLTFRMSDKKIKPTIGYLKDPYVSVDLKYDSKKDLYTVTAKSKK
ncbi:MAG TPA: hypothetical protein DHW61_02430 [Lachnoclostridium phytofermentans]|uniref:Transglutaminase-like domain-containing protein n=1 Tax=Lachnoclostridium phytofermentans TaxID=66219 RepID=A0A3D2X3P9_9FIRM|nr:transglutaminase domain-containing protein [Lachnoclostridium sp.]HCL01263.1 hypothetical protein [Lachnoclostridium phytofermentans]